jgi:hypothetical protein
MSSEPSLRSAEDAVAELKLWRGRRRGRERSDDAGEFGAGDPGERGLVLVFPLDLEEVEEVGCGGVDGDLVEVGGGGGGGVGCDGEGGGALEGSVLVGSWRELERFEGGWGERGWLLTSTYLETWIPRILTVGRWDWEGVMVK